jgi:hypothetical protein
MGQVRIPVTIDKAEEAIRELRKVAGGIKSIGDDAKKSAYSLEEVSRAFTPFRRNLEVVNQIRGAISLFVGAARTAGQVIGELAERTPRTRLELERFQAATGHVADEFVRGLDSGRRFSGMFNDMAGGMTGAADAARTLGVGISGLLSSLGELNRMIGAAQTGGLTVLLQAATDAAMRNTENVERYLGEGGPSALRDFVFDPNAGAEDIPRPGSGRGDHGAGSSRWHDTPARRRSGGGGRGSREFFSEAGASGGASGAQLGIEAAIADQYRAQLELLRDMNRERDTAQEKADMFRRSQAEAEEERRNRFEKEREQISDAIDKEIELARNRREFINEQMSSISTLAGAVNGLGKAVASAYEAMGGSSEKAKKVEGAFVVAYSSVMAALELAESIRAFAKQDYVSGALHLIGMAAYIAAAVEAGSQLGGGAAKTPSAQTSYTPARTEGLGAPSGEQQGNTIVNQYSWGRSRAEAAVAVADIEYEGARTGRVRGADASVWGA